MWYPEDLDPHVLFELSGANNYWLASPLKYQIEIQKIGLDYATFKMEARKGKVYKGRIEKNEDGLSCKCNCPVGAKGKFCKHCTAAAFRLRDKLTNDPPAELKWRYQIEHLLKNAPKKTKKDLPKTKEYLLAFALTESEGLVSGFWLTTVWIPFEKVQSLLGNKGVAEESENLSRAELNKWLQRRPHLLKSFGGDRFPTYKPKILNAPQETILLARALALGRRYYQRNDYYWDRKDKNLAEALTLISELKVPIFLKKDWNSYTPLGFASEFETVISLERVKGGFRLGGKLRIDGELISANRIVQITDKGDIWMMVNERVLVKGNRLRGGAHWLSTISKPILIPSKGIEDFREKYLPRILEQAQTPLEGDLVKYEHIHEKPVPRLYLQEVEGTLGAELRFGYGEYEVPYQPSLPEVSVVKDPHDPWRFLFIHRDPEAEANLHREAAQAKYGMKRGTKNNPALLLLRARTDPVDFLLDKVPKLAAAGFEIFGEEKLTRVRVNRSKPTLNVNITSGIDWFDVQAVVQFGEQKVSLAEIKRALRKKRRYIKLADGSIGMLPEEWLGRYKRLLGLAAEVDEETNTLRFADFHAAMLEELTEEAERAKADAAFRERLERLKDFKGITEHPLPKGLRGELRPYQVAGYNWLHFLHEYGFGGILADDMGLGKTVQVLAFLLSLRESGHSQAADLVVVPRSLLVNWQREVEKFTPGLKVLTYFGPNRPAPETFDNYDLILTTYGVMRVDEKKLRDYRFHYIVLDESQAIKNPLSKTARAARHLQCEHRLAMTGTPVENNTFELWAQFAFAMPGLLGSLDYFKGEFAEPIQKKQDEETARALRRMVYPFILRRTKEQVAPELPPRTERVLYCSMEPLQWDFYRKLRDYYREMLVGLIEREGLDKNRMKILEGLLRLRQASNHPKLIDPDFHGNSGKMEVLLEMLETLRSERHKALVFSQFVQMLHLVRQELNIRGIPYAYLDGSTRNRQEQVDRFQSDPNIPFFLISLKAGGVGLNLTAADYVIHIDPWWNPAVERQASDRTHRIGQDKPVFVFKLITRDSVEEKILQLQEQKKELVEKLIAAEGSFLKELSPEDVQALFS